MLCSHHFVMNELEKTIFCPTLLVVYTLFYRISIHLFIAPKTIPLFLRASTVI